MLLAADRVSRGSLRRICALVRRYIYLLRSSGIRLLEIIYWPFLQMLTWGFLQQYLVANTSPVAHAAGVLIGAVLLWDILFRSQDRLLHHLHRGDVVAQSRQSAHESAPPLRARRRLERVERDAAVVSMVPVSIAAYFFFGFNLLGLGLALVAFFAVLVLTGWALGCSPPA